MIDAAISHFADQLNEDLKRKYDLREDIVVVSSVANQDGSDGPDIDNKVVISLVHIQEDATLRSTLDENIGRDSEGALNDALVSLRLYFMVWSNFSGNNYLESLRFISDTLSFFRAHPRFDHGTTPELDERIHQLNIQMEHLTMDELSSLWGVLGGKYVPSVLYRVTMVASDLESVNPPILTIKTS